jgi:hypothetical protein
MLRGGFEQPTANCSSVNQESDHGEIAGLQIFSGIGNFALIFYRARI